MKEHIKSAVLVVLVIMNLILGSKVLSTKKLWSDNDYNFFSRSENPIIAVLSDLKDKFFKKAPTVTHLEMPELIIINTGYQTSRLALNRAEDEFNSLFPIIEDILAEAFAQPQKFQQTKSDDFYQALTAKSVYIHYPVCYDSSLFSYLMGIPSADFSQSFSELQNIVLSSDGSVYVLDSATQRVYRAQASASLQQLNAVIDSHVSQEHQNQAVINYAFDLGFDKAFGSQKAVLSPMIPIYSDELELYTINAKNPIKKSDSSFNENEISNILRVFGMHQNAFRRYTEADGTLVFVENDSVLRITENGIIDYSANDGVLIADSGLTQFDSVSAVADFADRVNSAAGSESAMQLATNLTSDELASSSLNISLDYIASGLAVNLDVVSVDKAVTLTIENGHIKKYRQLLRNYSSTGEKTTVANYILALDDAISKYENQLNEIEINSLKTVYNDDGSEGEKIPAWSVGIKDVVIAE